jgi:HSP20 family protein
MEMIMSLKITPKKNQKGLAPLGLNEWPVFGLRREMERVFDSFFRDFDLGSTRPWSEEFIPATNVMDNGKEIKVTAELPGLDEKDIEVVVSEDGITIKGEKKAEKEEKDDGRYLLERCYGSFYRNIPLPATVNMDKVEAKFKKGVLEVCLPKKEEAKKKEKKIDVKTAA